MACFFAERRAVYFVVHEVIDFLMVKEGDYVCGNVSKIRSVSKPHGVKAYVRGNTITVAEERTVFVYWKRSAVVHCIFCCKTGFLVASGNKICAACSSSFVPEVSVFWISPHGEQVVEVRKVI